MKPFLMVWAMYLVLMELIPVVFLSRFHIPEKADFSCFYAAGVLARTEPSQLYNVAKQMNIQVNSVGPENGWTVFIQPPYEALLLVPFSLLPYRSAYLLYLAFNVALIVPCFLLARDAFSHEVDPWQPRPGLLFFFFLPLFLAVLQGQGSVRLLLFCCSTWYLLKRGKDFSGGLLLALALFKMQVIIPLGLLLILWRGRRLLAGFLSGAILLAGLSTWLVSVRGMQAFGKLLMASSLIVRERPSEIPAAGLPPPSMPNLRGLLYGWGGKYLPHSWLLGLTLGLSAALLLWVTFLLRRERNQATGFALAIIAALLLSYYLHIHDLTLALLPIALLANRAGAYFTALVSVSFILPVLLLVWLGIQTQYLMAVPLLGFVLLIARGSPAEGSAPSQLEPAMQQITSGST